MAKPASLVEILDGAMVVALVLDDYAPTDRQRILDVVRQLDPGRTPDSTVIDEGTQGELPPMVATVVELLSEKSGLTTAEVGEALGIENRTAGIRLAHAQKLGVAIKSNDGTWSLP